MATSLCLYWQTFLGTCGLESADVLRYAALFAENEVGQDQMADLTLEALKELGITTLGHRMRIVKAAQAAASSSGGGGGGGGSGAGAGGAGSGAASAAVGDAGGAGGPVAVVKKTSGSAVDNSSPRRSGRRAKEEPREKSIRGDDTRPRSNSDSDVAGGGERGAGQGERGSGAVGPGERGSVAAGHALSTHSHSSHHGHGRDHAHSLGQSPNHQPATIAEDPGAAPTTPRGSSSSSRSKKHSSGAGAAAAAAASSSSSFSTAATGAAGAPTASSSLSTTSTSSPSSIVSVHAHPAAAEGASAAVPGSIRSSPLLAHNNSNTTNNNSNNNSSSNNSNNSISNNNNNNNSTAGAGASSASVSASSAIVGSAGEGVAPSPKLGRDKGPDAEYELLAKKMREQFGSYAVGKAEIEMYEKIGEGGYADVYRGRCRGEEVAVKVLHQKEIPEAQVAEFVGELRVISTLYHPNIVLFMGACLQPGEFMIITQYLKGGSLQNLLVQCAAGTRMITELQVLSIARDTCLGMNWLHSRNPSILHLDMKPGNLLIDEHFRVKVADFGISTFVAKGERTRDRGQLKGSLPYMAPERLRHKRFSTSADVYSFGITLWHCLTLQTPLRDMEDLFEQMDDPRKFMEIFCEEICTKNKRPDLSLLPQTPLHPRFVNLLATCWAPKPADRFSFAQLLDVFDGLILESAVLEPLGRQFWVAHYLTRGMFRLEAGWTKFLSRFEKHFNLGLIEPRAVKCLELLLVRENPTRFDAFEKEGHLVVSLEKFGQFLNWFGPLAKREDAALVVRRVVELAAYQPQPSQARRRSSAARNQSSPSPAASGEAKRAALLSAGPLGPMTAMSDSGEALSAPAGATASPPAQQSPSPLSSVNVDLNLALPPPAPALDPAAAGAAAGGGAGQGGSGRMSASSAVSTPGALSPVLAPHIGASAKVSAAAATAAAAAAAVWAASGERAHVFHGDISAQEAETLLAGCERGTWLVRVSSRLTNHPFVISKVSRQGQINHQRISFDRAALVYSLDIMYKEGLQRVSSDPGESLVSFLDKIGPDLFLRRACPGSKFTSVFLVSEKVQGYVYLDIDTLPGTLSESMSDLRLSAVDI